MNLAITRFAPSPTGPLHLGGARTALFCYLFSRHNKGKFILRIEDTDKNRSKQEYTQEIIEALEWLQLEWDEGPIHQSTRFDNYTRAAQKLLDKGLAYRCTCTLAELEAMREEQIKRGEKTKYDGRHRESSLGPNTKNYVIRFKNPKEGDICFNDLVKGDIKVNNKELDDMIIIRKDGSPTYNFCAVVDDIEMNISHIIRGDDHLLNSVRQYNLYKSFNALIPQFAHLPLILNKDGSRLSKRAGGNNILNYRDRGILSHALCSYMARLGWSYGDKEAFSRDELIELFDLNDVQKSAAHYDDNKMLWVNHNFIKNNDDLKEEIGKLLKALNVTPQTQLPLDDIIELHKDRADNLQQIASEIVFYYSQPNEYNENTFNQYINNSSITHIKKFRASLESLNDWKSESLKLLIKNFTQEQSIKFPSIGMPLRLAMSGSAHTPAVDKVAEILGKNETLTRLDKLINKYENKL